MTSTATSSRTTSFPHGQDGFEFFGANHSLERNVRYPPADGEQLHSPWSRGRCNTLTSQSKIIVRHKGVGGATMRALSSIEIMRMIGWDLGHWRNPACMWSETITPDILVSLARHAFSAFALTPVLIATFGAIGASQRPRVAPSTPEVAKHRSVSVGDDDADSGDGSSLSDGEQSTT